MAMFAEKHPMYTATDNSGAVTENIEAFVTALGARNAISAKSAVFLPKMEGVSNGNKLIVTNLDKTTTCPVYKLNVPGFFYYQYWRNSWNSAGWLRILACNNSTFTGDVFELLNTKDLSNNGNDHSNNMFPVNPGTTNLYVMLLGTIAGDATNITSKDLYYIPAWGTTDAGDAITKTNVTIAKAAINALTVKQIDSDSIANFKSLFEYTKAQ